MALNVSTLIDGEGPRIEAGGDTGRHDARRDDEPETRPGWPSSLWKTNILGKICVSCVGLFLFFYSGRKTEVAKDGS